MGRDSEAEVGLLPLAQGAREVEEANLPPYSHPAWGRLYSQSQLLTILCLMGYED